MVSTKENQLIKFEKIPTLSPSKQIDAVMELATKENSRLNGALNAYLAQLYKFTLDGEYDTDDKTIMRHTSKTLVDMLKKNEGPIEELDTYTLNTTRNTALVANVINTEPMIPEHFISKSMR